MKMKNVKSFQDPTSAQISSDVGILFTFFILYYSSQEAFLLLPELFIIFHT